MLHKLEEVIGSSGLVAIFMMPKNGAGRILSLHSVDLSNKGSFSDLCLLQSHDSMCLNL